jgi:hypothetical protein
LVRCVGYVTWYRTTCYLVSDNMLRGIGQHVIWYRTTCYVVSDMVYGVGHVTWYRTRCYVVSDHMLFGIGYMLRGIGHGTLCRICYVVSDIMLRGIGHHVIWYRTTCYVVSDNMFRGIGQDFKQYRTCYVISYMLRSIGHVTFFCTKCYVV